jgi:hypothetical protein
VETRLPVPEISLLNAEAGVQEKQAFSRYIDMLERLDRVSAKVLHANAELCQKTGPDIGVLTHTKKTYPKHLREAVARHLGAGDTPSILIVRKGSSAEKAGLEYGDVLISDDEVALSADDKKIASMLEDSQSILKRSDTDAGFTKIGLEAHSACRYPVHLKFSEAVNAYANGKSIIVTTGMMDFAATDEELALVVGHELAHNTMRHVRKSIQNILLSGFATRYTRPFEAEADYVGLYYMARAGYEIDGVEIFWRRLGIKNPKSIVRAKTHPITPGRLLSIRATAQEIHEKTDANVPLVPNYLDGKEPDIAP